MSSRLSKQELVLTNHPRKPAVSGILRDVNATQPATIHAIRAATQPLEEPGGAISSGIDPLRPTIFHERWWLDAVAPGRWQSAEVRQHGKLVGWMPYVLSRHRGFRVSVMPPLTHLLGPAIDEAAGGPNTGWLRQLGIMQELAAQMPDVSHFSQTFHPGAPHALAFQACGFESFVQFTAEVDPAPENLLWSRLRDKTRNVIRRAEEQCRVDALDDGDEFARFYRANLQLAGDRSYFDTSLIAPLFDAARSRGQAQILAARSPQGRIIAAVFYVWDARRVSYFLSTRDPHAAHNGAVSLLVWRGIQMAAHRQALFDFDGISAAGVARFYGAFGAQFRPRLAVWKRSLPYALFSSAADIVRGRSTRNVFTAP